MKSDVLKPFPGMELFPDDQAIQLCALIERITDSQPSLSRVVLGSAELDWSTDDFPSTIAIDGAEDYAKQIGCAAIAIQSARALGIELSAAQIPEILKQAELVYEEIPHLVHALLLTAE